MEIFGETPFSPEAKETAPAYDEAQRELDLLFSSRSGQITNEYIKGEERSFTIVAYPVPEIGADYAKIFDEVIKINTLDAKLYEKVQQTMIDALDQGTCVHVRGKGENHSTPIWSALLPVPRQRSEPVLENYTPGSGPFSKKTMCPSQQPFSAIRILQFRTSPSVPQIKWPVHTWCTRKLRPAGTVYGRHVRLFLLQRKQLYQGEKRQGRVLVPCD